MCINKNLIQRAIKFNVAFEMRQKKIYPFFRAIESEQDTEVLIDGKSVLMFGSNSYLGLNNHPKIKEAAQKATAQYGTGCGGSRLLNGTLKIHNELEEVLADYLQREACLLYSTGFQANLGALAPLASRHDYILIDERVHASIIDAARLTFAKVLKFAHNDMKDLERLISSLPQSSIKFIVADGIFSMEGDLCNLPEIVRISKQNDGVVIIDDAHSIGVIGETGIGTGSHFRLHGAVDIQIGTFSKSLASLGGFIASSADIIDYLKHSSRSLIFSASLPPAATASVLAAIKIIKEEPERIENLWKNTSYAIKVFREIGFEIGNTQSPIIPLFIRDSDKTLDFSMRTFYDGLFINPVLTPAVPSEESLIRFSLMATHTHAQIDRAAEVLYRNAVKLNILNP